MISKTLKLRAIRTDLNTNQKELIAKGKCELQDECRLLYTEPGPSGAEVIVETDGKTMKIQRFADVQTVMLLDLGHASISRVMTAEGTFEIGNRTSELELRQDRWRVVYEIGEHGQPAERFRIEWFFKEAEA